MYTPDKWMIVKILGEDKPFYKVFATWSGGYLASDSWQMNSGIVKIEQDDDHYYFIGESGSTYKCYHGSYGSTSYGDSIMTAMLNKHPDKLTFVEEDDWKTEMQEFWGK